MDEKILTQHPEGKRGVRIDRRKYDLVRTAILAELRRHGEMTYTELADAVGSELDGRFDGSVRWYVETVKLDLEAKHIIHRLPNSRPTRIQLV